MKLSGSSLCIRNCIQCIQPWFRVYDNNNICTAQTARANEMSLRDHCESVEERWQREMKGALPAWIDAIRPATVKRTAIGASIACHCNAHRQVQARCDKDATQPLQAQLLRVALDRQHGGCHQTTVTEAPHPLAQQVDKLRTAVKRK